jgi:hypothetical protein
MRPASPFLWTSRHGRYRHQKRRHVNSKPECDIALDLSPVNVAIVGVHDPLGLEVCDDQFDDVADFVSPGPSVRLGQRRPQGQPRRRIVFWYGPSDAHRI